ncbi:hypothetical protein QTN94_15990 [Vibrio sp. M250220]|uniref:hypothetical protein n=1 Tax=Vibrio sp. M250220 TaxID=3020894 RepID=UPI002F3E4D2E
MERQLVSIAKQFGDMGVKADLVESKGKTFVAFNGTDQNGRVLKVGEAAIFAAPVFGLSVVMVGAVVFVVYAVIEVAWSEYDVNNKIVMELENAIEN